MPGKKLYQLAAKVYKTKLWDMIRENDLFAVKFDDGEIGYISAINGMEGHYSLPVYIGNEGFMSLSAIYDEDAQGSRFEYDMRTMAQRCMFCSFDSLEYRDERDKAEHLRLGIKSVARNRCIRFRKCEPLCLPWYVEDEADERRMELALEAALEVAKRLASIDAQQDMFHEPSGGITADDKGVTGSGLHGRIVPLFTPKPDGNFELGEIELPQRVSEPYESFEIQDQLLMARIRKTRKLGNWECGLVLSPKPVVVSDNDGMVMLTELDQAPVFPVYMLIVDGASGLVLHCSASYVSGGYAEKLVSELAAFMLTYVRPYSIRVGDERTYRMLDAFCQQAGVGLSLEVELELLDEVMDDFREHMDDDYLDDDDDD